ncbi:MAG: cobalamin-dependent protein [Ktedonobacterales bacterium]
MSYGGANDKGQGGSGGFGGTYKSGGAGSGKDGEPPNLAAYSPEPKYDLATIVQLVGVRPMILWGWEQQLGIPAPARIPSEEPNGATRRYSERDLVASIWLRDQILHGTAPNEAAAKLLGAQCPYADDDGQSSSARNALTQGPGPRGPAVTSPLRDSTFVQGRSSVSGRLTWGVERGAISRPLGQSGPLSGVTRGGPSGPLMMNNPVAEPNPSSDALRGNGPASNPGAFPSGTPQHMQTGGPSGALGRIGNAAARPEPASPNPWLSMQPQVSRAPAMSRPLAQIVSPPSLPPQHDTFNGNEGAINASGVSWIGPGTTHARGGELRALVPQLVRAFAAFDNYTASRIVREALTTRSVETVCISLLQPAQARASEMWARRELTMPEERFAQNFVRGILFSLFHNTPERFDGPTVFVGCGPREVNDIAVLMLAVFWRHAGLRVVYLGTDLEAASLVDEIRARRPALVALTATAPQRVRSLAKVAKTITQLEAPRPIFTFGGPAFARNPELQRRVSGVYLGDDAATATWHVTNLLGADRFTAPGA